MTKINAYKSPNSVKEDACITDKVQYQVHIQHL